MPIFTNNSCCICLNSGGGSGIVVNVSPRNNSFRGEATHVYDGSNLADQDIQMSNDYAFALPEKIGASVSASGSGRGFGYTEITIDPTTITFSPSETYKDIWVKDYGLKILGNIYANFSLYLRVYKLPLYVTTGTRLFDLYELKTYDPNSYVDYHNVTWQLVGDVTLYSKVY